MSDPAGHQRFFAELKRRHVFRVMAVYGIVGFVILQVADLAIPALLLPEWTYRFVALILLLGFPIAVIVAWAFEVTPEGIKKTEAADSTQIEAIVAQPAVRRWSAGLLALLGGGLLLYGGWWLGSQAAPGATVVTEAEPSETRLAVAGSESARPTIAVLPFADMSPEGDQEYFSDGITEELLNTLAKIRDLKVMARTSAFAFKGENLDMRAVGDSLDARYLVEGSVRKAGDQLRITAQLIDAEDGSHLWSEAYDRRLENVFAIQTEIAEAIAAELRVPLGLAEGERLVSATEDFEAYDLYLQGRHFWNQRNSEDLAVARGLFSRAIEMDSSFAPAYAAIADAWVVPAAWEGAGDASMSESERIRVALDEGIRYARLALDLDPTLAQAHTALAYGLTMRDLDFRRAEESFARAIELDSEYATAHQWFAELLSAMDRHEEAVVEVRRAEALDPTRIIRWNVGRVLYFAGRYEEAIEQLEPLAAEPGVHTGAAFAYQAMSYQMLEDYEGLLALLERAMRERPPPPGADGPPPGLLEGARAAVAAGEMPRFLANLSSSGLGDAPYDRELTRAARSWSAVDADSAFALLDVALGDPDDAAARVAWFDVLTDPAFDVLRDDPRYEELAARFGF